MSTESQAAVRTIIGLALYAALLALSLSNPTGIFSLASLIILAAFFAAATPVAAVASLPLLPLMKANPIPLAAGLLLGLGASLATGFFNLPKPRRKLRLRAVAAALAGASLTLSIIAGAGFFRNIEAGFYLLGLASSLIIVMLTAWDERLSLLLGLASGFSWYGLPAAVAVSTLWVRRPDTYSKGILVGRLTACIHVCSRILKRKENMCWHPVTPHSLRINPFAYRNPHILIAGMSGSGKTTLAKRLVVGLSARGVGVLVLDFHGEYGDLEDKGYEVLDATQLPLNLLDLEGSSPREKASEIADIIQMVFGMGSLQRVTLEQLIEEAYESKGIYQHDPSTWSREPPTLLNVALTLRQHLEASSSSSEKSRLAGIAMYLDLLSRTFYQQSAASSKSLLGRQVVVKLDSLPGEHVKTLYVETLLRRLAVTMYRGGLPGPQIIVVEEAHRIASREKSKRSTLARLLVESRKYDLGFIVISQQPLDLDEAILANTWLKFIFSLQEPRNIDYIAKTMGIHDKSLHKTLKGLKRGEALVEAGGTICSAVIAPPR